MSLADDLGVPSDLRDQALFSAIRLGDQAAFTELFLKYWDDLVEFTTHHVDVRAEAEEVVQDLFVRLWNLGERAGTCQSVRAYLFTAARRGAWMVLRRRRSQRRWQALAQRCGDIDLRSEGADESVRMRDCMELIERVLSRLSPTSRRAFELSRVREIKEVAVALDMTVDAVKSHIKRAFVAIRREVVSQLSD